MLFSIIVPVYKVEQYIKQCIDSVLNQSFTDYELILVDDGSPDNSGEICRRYANENGKIVYIKKDNGGVSDARNVGLETSSGDYVIFLDSDDFIIEGILQRLSIFIKRERPDNVICALNYIYDDYEKEKALSLKPLFKVVDRNHMYTELSKSTEVHWNPGRNVYRRDIIEANNIRFPKGTICAEDCDFFMDFVRSSTKFTFFDYPLINYRVKRKGSVTGTTPKGSVMNQLEIFSKNYYIYIKDNRLKKYFAKQFGNAVYQLSEINDKVEISQCKEFIEKNRVILNDLNDGKYLIARIVWMIMGFNKGSKLLKMGKHIRT